MNRDRTARTLAVLALLLSLLAAYIASPPGQAQVIDALGSTWTNGASFSGGTFTIADTSGNTTIAGSLAANGGITADTTKFTVADTSGNTRTAGTLAVEGASTFTGTLTTVAGATIAGALAANAGITADTTAFTVADTSGNVRTAGTLAVEGASTFTGTLTTVAAATVGTNLTINAGGKIIPQNATNYGVIFAARNTVAYTDITTKTMFVLPANVDIIDYSFIATTAFNSSGTDLMSCGTTSADPNEYLNDLVVSATGVTRMGAGATSPFAAQGDVGASNVTVLCLFVQSVADATAGAGVFIVQYRVD